MILKNEDGNLEARKEIDKVIRGSRDTHSFPNKKKNEIKNEEDLISALRNTKEKNKYTIVKKKGGEKVKEQKMK